MDLRRFEAGDLSAVQELFAGSIPHCLPGGYTPAQLETWANRAGRITARASAGLLHPGGRGGGASAGLWESGAGRTSGTACIRQRAASAGEWQHRSVTPWKPKPGGRGESFCGWRLPVLPGAFLSGGGIRWQQPSWCRWMARNLRISAWRRSCAGLFHTKQTHKTALTGETETVRTESADTANANFGEKMKKSRNFLENRVDNSPFIRYNKIRLINQVWSDIWRHSSAG